MYEVCEVSYYFRPKDPKTSQTNQLLLYEKNKTIIPATLNCGILHTSDRQINQPPLNGDLTMRRFPIHKSFQTSPVLLHFAKSFFLFEMTDNESSHESEGLSYRSSGFCEIDQSSDSAIHFWRQIIIDVGLLYHVVPTKTKAAKHKETEMV